MFRKEIVVHTIYVLRGCSLFIGGGGSEDFRGATNFFLEILGGYEIFSRILGVHENIFRNFWGSRNYFFNFLYVVPFLLKNNHLTRYVARDHSRVSSQQVSTILLSAK